MCDKNPADLSVKSIKGNYRMRESIHDTYNLLKTCVDWVKNILNSIMKQFDKNMVKRLEQALDKIRSINDQSAHEKDA
jgi:hypothetical protein